MRFVIRYEEMYVPEQRYRLSLRIRDKVAGEHLEIEISAHKSKEIAIAEIEGLLNSLARKFEIIEYGSVSNV